MKRSKSSRAWLSRQARDPYVKEAEQAGYRSRAVFKLQEIQHKYRLIRAGMTVVELGSAPGSWSEQLADYVGKHGRVIATDRLPMEPVQGVEFIQGDFHEQAMLDAMLARVGSHGVDCVVSDMAPNLSGNPSLDMPRCLYLGELALEFAQKTLILDGSLIIKLFNGQGFEDYRDSLKRCFCSVAIFKPRASRPQSREVYLVATGFRDQLRPEGEGTVF